MFLDWAAQCDTGGRDIRSRALHEERLAHDHHAPDRPAKLWSAACLTVIFAGPGAPAGGWKGLRSSCTVSAWPVGQASSKLLGSRCKLFRAPKSSAGKTLSPTKAAQWAIDFDVPGW